nr:hypothetical protein [Acinetobacter sp. Marseille-Q1620]
MYKNFLKKAIFSLFLISILSACTLKKAVRSYENGDYISSIRIVTDRLDEKRDYPRNSLKKSWLNTVYLSLNKIENLPDNSLEQKIQRYEEIYQARNLVGTGFYSNNFTAFNQRYPMPQLKFDIAKLYYEKGNNIKTIVTDNYREKAEAYQNGLKYANYLDMASLAAKYQKEYSSRLASDYYQSALTAVKMKNYKDASENFQKASNAFSNYGSFKDSQQQFVKYDKLWRSEEAEQFFSQAISKDRSATRKADFREAAKLYNDSYEIYLPYGIYKNSVSLRAISKRKGTVNIGYSINQDRGDDSCGSSYSDSLSKRIKRTIEDRFKSYPFELSPIRSADIQLYFDYRTRFQRGNLEQSNQVQSIVDPQGKTVKFNQHNESRRNQYEITMNIEAMGDVQMRKRISKETSSEENKVFYSGAVPQGYRDKTQGSLKNQSDSCLEIISDLEREIDYVLDDIAEQGMRI